MSQSGGSAGGTRKKPARPLGSSASTLSARLAAAAAANAANQPTFFGLLAGRRLARQFADRVYAKRAANSDSGTDGVEPTYRMEPLRRFDVKHVEELIRDVMTSRLTNFRYTARKAVMLTKILVEEIKEAVKELDYDRYKIVCLVTIGENRNQDLLVTSRCTWDLKTDNSASHTWQSPHCFCTATVFGLYHE